MTALWAAENRKNLATWADWVDWRSSGINPISAAAVIGGISEFFGSH
jgi:hypothetical protein